jgi:hypothetical protein
VYPGGVKTLEIDILLQANAGPALVELLVSTGEDCQVLPSSDEITSSKFLSSFDLKAMSSFPWNNAIAGPALVELLVSTGGYCQVLQSSDEVTSSKLLESFDLKAIYSLSWNTAIAGLALVELLV